MTVFRVEPKKRGHKVRGEQGGAGAEGGEGGGCKFCAACEQQLAAAGAAPPSIHLARCGFGGLGGGFSGGGFSSEDFSGGVFSCGDAPPAVAVVSGFAAPAAAPSAHAEAFSQPAWPQCPGFTPGANVA